MTFEKQSLKNLGCCAPSSHQIISRNSHTNSPSKPGRKAPRLFAGIVGLVVCVLAAAASVGCGRVSLVNREGYSRRNSQAADKAEVTVDVHADKRPPNRPNEEGEGIGSLLTENIMASVTADPATGMITVAVTGTKAVTATDGHPERYLVDVFADGGTGADTENALALTQTSATGFVLRVRLAVSADGSFAGDISWPGVTPVTGIALALSRANQGAADLSAAPAAAKAFAEIVPGASELSFERPDNPPNSPTATPTGTVPANGEVTPTPTATVAYAFSGTPTASPTPTATVGYTYIGTASATPTATTIANPGNDTIPTPTQIPIDMEEPTWTPSPTPTLIPITVPTAMPTATPTEMPRYLPPMMPTATPVDMPPSLPPMMPTATPVPMPPCGSMAIVGVIPCI
jgi:hypothetical protein